VVVDETAEAVAEIAAATVAAAAVAGEDEAAIKFRILGATFCFAIAGSIFLPRAESAAPKTV